MSLHIKVTKQNIDDGVPGMPRSCPIARAVREQVNDACLVSVGVSHITVVDNDDNYVRFSLPKQARDFVNAFDRDFDVQPFEFDAIEEERGQW